MRKLPWQRSGYQSCDTFLLAVSQLVRWILKPCVGTSDWSQWTWLRSHLEINKTFLLFLHAIACCFYLLMPGENIKEITLISLAHLCFITHMTLWLFALKTKTTAVEWAWLLWFTPIPPPWASQYPRVWVKGDKMKASEGWVTTPQGHNLSLVCLLSQHTQQRENTLFTEDEGNSDHLTEHTLLCEASSGLPHIRKDGCQVK